MIQGVLKPLWAGFLVVIIFAGTVSKEWLHTFANHEDTIETHCLSSHENETYLDNEHHHCDFLSYTLTSFTPSFFETIVCLPQVVFIDHQDKTTQFYFYNRQHHNFLRGPPLT